ncbi:MAG: hypothetical protein ABI910_00275 [Gemmatimonadota bacterium]
MLVLRDWLKRARPLLLGAAMVAGVVACGEDLESGAACPILCSGQNLAVFDTTLDAVSFDTTVLGIPGFGTEGSLYLASRGDTLDVRAVVRFDSLPTTFLSGGADSAITRLDSAYLALLVNATSTHIRGSVRVDLFDVDTAEADTVNAVVLSLFRPDRLIGGTTFDSAQVKDSIKVFFNNAKLLGKITGQKRLRVGIKVTAAAGAELDLASIEGGGSPILRFDPAPEDTAIKAIGVFPVSNTPPFNTVVSGDYLDYTIVAAAPAPPTGAILAVGGIPNKRAFLRFVIPSRILDSSTVLRATLMFTQQPNRTIDPRDSIAIVPEISLATEEVTDVTRSALLLAGFAFDTLRVAPGDSGARVLEVATAVRQWASANAATIPQQKVLVLRSTREGTSPFEFHLSSREAPTALRPRLRVSYALRTSFGIP